MILFTLIKALTLRVSHSLTTLRHSHFLTTSLCHPLTRIPSLQHTNSTKSLSRFLRALSPSLPLSIYLSIYLSVCLSACLSVYLSISVPATHNFSIFSILDFLSLSFSCHYTLLLKPTHTQCLNNESVVNN